MDDEELQSEGREPAEPLDDDIRTLDADERLDWLINRLMDEEGNRNFT